MRSGPSSRRDWRLLHSVTAVSAPVTNLVLKSQQFDNAAWTKTRVTITADQTAAPDGTTTADLLTEDATTNFRLMSQGSLVTVASAPYTYSVYVKMGTLPTVQITDSLGNFFCNFDLQNGAVGTKSASVTGYIIAATNGFYRLVVTRTMGASETAVAFFLCPTNSASAARAPSYLGSGRTAYVWQAQLIAGTDPTGGTGTVTP